MADDYTPTTDEVRGYVEGGGDIGGWGSLTRGQEIARVQAFDRWLAAHDAEVRAGRVTVAPDRVLGVPADQIRAEEAWDSYWPTRWFQPNDGGLEGHKQTFLAGYSAN